MANDKMQTTLLIVKPDGVQRGLVGSIIARFEAKGLQIAGLKLMTIPKELAHTHYEAHKERSFFPGLVRFMTSSPVVVFAVRGLGVIDLCRGMMGATDSAKAAAGTIRGDFGNSKGFNLIHGSDSPEAAARELGLFFKPGEVIEYDLARTQWVYDPAELA
jgi:nucleoside-diphosphate kinase